METVATVPHVSPAVDRLLHDMRAVAPAMAEQAEAWMQGLSRTGIAADYFQHPLAFPMLLLPRWVEESLQGEVTEPFQADLTYSSISGYYFIRMVDNVMDEQSALETQLLPMTGFFHAQATRVYHRYFPYDHLFWAYFAYWNAQSAALAIEDGMRTGITFDDFQQIAGKKVIGGKIPVVAVLARYDHLGDLAAWEPFYDKLSCWHQMFNDVLSWHKDMQHGTASYFLCEGDRRKAAHETRLAWLLREGFTWGLETLTEWLQELHRLADDLNSPGLTHYLRHREHLLQSQMAELKHSVALMAQLLTQ
ncbi:MAG: hypothetical protein OHK0046_17970 [Anaerolineae bacterium]